MNRCILDEVLGQAGLQAGPVALDFEHSGRLDIEAQGERVRLCLSHPVAGHSTGTAAAALALADPFRSRPFTLHAGFSGSDLVFLTHVAAERFDRPTLEAAIAMLSEAAEAAAAGPPRAADPMAATP